MRSVLLLFHYYQEDCDAEFYTDFYHRSVRHADGDSDCYRHCNGDPNGDAHCNPDDDYGDVGGRDLSYFGRIGNALCGGNGLRRERHRLWPRTTSDSSGDFTLTYTVPSTPDGDSTWWRLAGVS